MDLSERPASPASAARHPWEIARFEFFRDVVARLPAPPRAVLDVGAGDGWLAGRVRDSLPSATRMVCWDAHYTAELMASLAGEVGPQVEFVAERPQQVFDLVMLLDVLEHVEHDLEFLASIVRQNMPESGLALISVPAWQPLFTAHDTRLRHYRRYSPAAARRLITDAGLVILRRGGLFHSLLVPRAASKLLELLRPTREKDDSPPSLEWGGGPLVTGVLRAALAADRQLSHLATASGIELPGLSWWAVCQKR